MLGSAIIAGELEQIQFRANCGTLH
jgi:hypothetical protein